MSNTKMVRYNLLKAIELTPLVSCGIISLTIATWLQIYELYLDELKENQKVIAIQFTADYYNISERNIYKIINFMEN
jgi:hypothetical protein